ncbi:MAG: heme o synthase [Desulfurococcales archaeon]|nr:heme o synthase [Desulfurococcales archaeon]
MANNSLAVKARAIWVMMKPLQLFLLSVTLFGAYFAAGGRFNAATLALLVGAAIGGIGGVTALNMVLEADIDALMPRTAGRPVPSGLIGPGEALSACVAITFLGLLSALAINRYVAFSVLLGLVFDIIMYTEIAKRRSPVNILLGGVAGGAPALGGWAAARGTIDLGGALLAGVVMSWIPMHIWFISSYYMDDYARAGIPMAPLVLPPKRVTALIKASLLVMDALLWAFVAVEGYGMLAASLASLLVALSMRAVSRWEASPDRERARALFKFASPVIAAVFIALPIDYWLLGGVMH